MKLFSKKTIFILLLLFIIALLILSTYYAFLKYNSYKNHEKTLQKRELFTHANNLLKALEKERLKSILYLIEPNQKNLNRLNRQRKRVNNQIKNSKALNLNKQITELLDIRKKINTLSLENKKLIYSRFHLKIISPIISKIETLRVSPYASIELQLIKLRENINMENSFLAPILIQKKVMQREDILFWEKILDLKQLPNFNDIYHETLLNSIKEEYNESSFLRLNEKRVEIFIQTKNANYPISFKEWFIQTAKQKSQINHIEKLLSTPHNNQLKNQFLAHQGEMYRSIIISLLILILLGLLLGILRILEKMDREKYILKKSVEEIEVDLDENKKREIQEILTHNSTVEVYEFLINQIREPSRAKDLFLANMSHEIRTPLNGIIGFTKELKETTLSEEQHEIVSIIEESSNNLMHIVNDILDFSKLKAGKVELEKIRFDPIEKFEAAIDTFVAKAREKEIEFKVCIDPHIPTYLLGDPTKIVQILSNLISNAVKFTPQRGCIEVEIHQTSNRSNKQQNLIQLYFCVKDSGIGISHKEQKEIFNAFSQADASTSRKYGGTGLGLSIASQFIKKMGGELKIESQVGKGSKFFFTIFLEKPQNLQSRVKKNLSPFKVGYIPPDGSQSIDKNLKTYVEYQGAKFFTYTQRTLLNLVESELPDLLFIDYKCFDKEGDLEFFLDLPLKIVLIVAENRENELGLFREKIDKILHKPVNFTRTIKSLEVLTQISKDTVTSSKTPKEQFSNLHALVAEDNFINQKLMKNILNRLGINVTIVKNGEEAVEYRKTHEYDIIFMDIQMPVMGGVEATKNILSFEKHSNKKHIPVVALTANALEGDKEKYMAIGMDAYLSKPMDLEELKKILNTLIEK